MPIITRFLTPSDYGTLSIFDSIVGFLAVFVGLGSQEMVKVNYFKQEKDELKYYIGNVFLITLITSLIYTLVFLFTANFFTTKYGLSLIWLVIAVIITLGGFFQKIISLIWIAEGNSLAFGKYQNAFSLITVLTTILLVVVIQLNWQGRVYSLLASTIIFSWLAFYYINKKGFFAIEYNPRKLWQCAKESAGVLPYSVSFWFKNTALMLLIATFIGKHETGLYASAFRIAIIVNFATLSLNKVWQPHMFKLLAQNNVHDEVKIVKSIYVYLFLIISVGIGIIVFADFIVKLALAEEYADAANYVRYLTVAVVLQSLFTAMGDLMMFFKTTKNLTIVSVTGIALQYLLIYVMGLLFDFNVMTIIYSAIIAGIYTLVVSWVMVAQNKKLPWLFFLSKRPNSTNKQ